MSPVIGQFLSFCYRRAWLVWVLAILFAGLGAWNARNLRLNVSAEGLVPEDSPLRASYDETKRVFGSDYIVGVYVDDPELFTLPKLERLQKLAEQLAKLPNVESVNTAPATPLAKAPARTHIDLSAIKQLAQGTGSGQKAATQPTSYVERSESIFTIGTIDGKGGSVSTGPALDPMPENAEELAAAKERLLRNPLLVGTLISRDAQATIITLYLSPAEAQKPDFDTAFVASVEKLLAPEKAHFAQIFPIGAPVMHVAITQYIFRDQMRLLPLACVILLSLLGLMMRSVNAVILLLINAILANCWTLGMMALLGIPLNMLNYVVPALVVMIGSGSDVHLLIGSSQQRARGLTGLQAISETGRLIGLSLLLNTGTTVLGFASTLLTDISILREFGESAALAISLRFISTMFVVPAYLRLTDRWSAPVLIDGHGSGQSADGWWERYLMRPYIRLVSQHLVQRPGLVMLICGGITAVSLVFASRIRLDNDFAAFLRADSPVMQQLNTVSKRLSGTDIIDVYFHGEPGEYHRPERLRQLFDFEQQYLRKQHDVDSVMGLPDIIALFNREFHDGDAAYFAIPNDSRAITQPLGLMQPSDLQPYTNRDGSKINIVMRCNLHNTTLLNQLVADIDHTLNSEKYGVHHFVVTGHAVLAAASVDSIAQGQVASLSSMVAILGGTVALVFLSWRAAASAIAANLTPIAVVFAVMGLTHVPLNLGTCMIAAISIGMAVDNTINLMVRYHDDLRRTRNETTALHDTMCAEFKPVVLSGLSMAGGFMALSVSSFVPMQEFGLLSALVMLLACFGDLLVTAAMLGNSRIITVWGVLDVKLRRAIVKQSPVFEGFSTWQAKKLIAASDIEEYPAGHHLIADGAAGDTMYVVLEGELEVSKGSGPNRLELNRLGPGQVIGEVALVAKVQRTADVTALTPVKVLSLTWRSLCELQRFSPFLAARLNLNLAKILGLRLADTLKKTQNPFPAAATPLTSVPWKDDTKPSHER